MKNLVTQISLPTAVAAYLFICGTLYIIGFWSNFNIDISSLIDLSDIPKAFVLPFIYANGLYVAVISSQFFIGSYFPEDKTLDESGELKQNKLTNWRKFTRIFFSLDSVTYIALTTVTYLYFDFKMHPVYWSASCIAIAIIFTLRLRQNSWIKSQITNPQVRYYTCHFFIALPLFSFSNGKVDSLYIYNNNKYHLIYFKDKNIPPIDSNCKFLGFIGDKVIISTVDNRKQFVLNQSHYNTIEFIPITKNDRRRH